MDEFLRFFLSQGVLGAIAIGEFLIIAFLYRENKELNTKRLEDLRTIQNVMVEPQKKLQETCDKIIARMEQNNDILLNLLSKFPKI